MNARNRSAERGSTSRLATRGSVWLSWRGTLEVEDVVMRGKSMANDKSDDEPAKDEAMVDR